jgi:hypothetical protein
VCYSPVGIEIESPSENESGVTFTIPARYVRATGTAGGRLYEMEGHNTKGDRDDHLVVLCSLLSPLAFLLSFLRSVARCFLRALRLSVHHLPRQ